MELQTFRELLNLFYSEGGDERESAEAALSSFSQENLPQLLIFLNQLLLEDDPNYQKRSAALLYAQCRRNPQFLTAEILTNFWPLFAETYQQTILSKYNRV